MKFFIYRNLHQRGYTYSIKALEGDSKGRVIGYSSFFVIEDVEFRVSQPGRQRVVSTRRKGIHAGMVGTIVHLYDYVPRILTTIEKHQRDYDLFARPSQQIKYNPYVAPTFYDVKTNDPVYRAEVVVVSGSLVEAFTLTS